MPRPDLGRVPFRLRVSAHTLAMLERVAADSGQSVHDYVRDLLDEDAKANDPDRPTAEQIRAAHTGVGPRGEGFFGVHNG